MCLCFWEVPLCCTCLCEMFFPVSDNQMVISGLVSIEGMFALVMSNLFICFAVGFVFSLYFWITQSFQHSAVKCSQHKLEVTKKHVFFYIFLLSLLFLQNITPDYITYTCIYAIYTYVYNSYIYIHTVKVSHFIGLVFLSADTYRYFDIWQSL